MTAVASPPTFTQHNRPAWGMNGMNRGGPGAQIMNPDELNRMFMPRKSLQRNNSSSSLSSNSSTSSTSTVATSNSQTNGASPMSASGDLSSWPNAAATAQRKRPQAKAPWPASKQDAQTDFARMSAGRPQLVNGLNGSAMHSASPVVPSQALMAAQQAMPRPMTESIPTGNQPVLYLLSLNGTFERKTISVPFSPDTLRIGRQTNVKTVPTPINGFFDSKVLSRQHAEIWADRQGKIWIRDVKSSNGTFVNGTRLSQENRESEPHELQTGDHLELGIDIVSEDQKTVVHHKVAAKVEHSGFLNASSNLLDVNFGDLDPTNGSMIMMGPQGAVPARQRNGSQASMASNGRIIQGGAMMGPQANCMGHQRGFFFSPISTEQIVKRLQQEMRSARLQSQDLGRTGHFVQALLSKEEIKDLEKPEVAEPPKANMVNGNGMSFRSDNKTRFSDPPAPPPQQPLPEKPDVPSLKRGITERAKPNAQSISPIRQDGNVSQILQLTEALNTARREIETQTSRMRDLEEMLQKERQARELAEELARRLEDSAAANTNGAPVKLNGEEAALEAAFEPPADEAGSPDPDTPTNDVAKDAPTDTEVIETSATQLHAQIETMVSEMKDLRQQLENFKQRTETAEAERDADRKSLAGMALQIRKDAEVREAAAREKTLADARAAKTLDNQRESSQKSSTMVSTPSSGSSQGQTVPGESNDQPTLSRANTITPDSAPAGMLTHEQTLADSIPYASMIGVVILGMGLMAYINGWQPQPRVER
ncbi:Uu.00g118500.m01.CDS01 [Anthostomella pinea]|uniref:Uu.00g118500.m01.CDS01 n=1 Tax=Anthostomella pinea TaxID=933095 RepID=A0AAI8YH19_9PEZI|nr:Uu.00g118500.m01.CDS01 [Anthostomella pinea]